MRPFKKGEPLSGGSLETLCTWLEENCDKTTKLTSDYTVADLIADIDDMLDGMWSDGVDAMGEDA
jgi:hypothetical protein